MTGTNPFTYDPSAGNLLVSITLSGELGADSFTSFDADLSGGLIVSRAYSVRLVDLFPYNGAIPPEINNGLVTRFEFHTVQRVVLIDIKPGSFPNSINPNSKGRTPVAILTTDMFDATTVDPNTVAFGTNGAHPVHAALEDVDGDGDTDLILHFNTQHTGIHCGDTSASLTGKTFGGQAIEGSGSINTVGCE